MTYNVCCSETSFRIKIQNKLFIVKTKSKIFLCFLKLFYIINYFLLKRIFIEKRTCNLDYLCSSCHKIKGMRCDFYHLTQRRHVFKKDLEYYFHGKDYDYFKLMESSIYDIELALRQEYSQQYYNGILDNGHIQWMEHLQSNTNTNIKFSNYFWKELLFQLEDDNYTNKVNITKKYDLNLPKSPYVWKSWALGCSTLDIYDLSGYNNNQHIDDSEIVTMFYECKNLDYW